MTSANALTSVPCCLRQVEVVERARDVEVRVGVEAVGEAQPLVAQVALDLEVGRERERVVVDVLQAAAELLLHRLVAEVGDVADHARDAEALGRRLAAVVVAAAPVGVGHDRLAADLVEGDRHGGLARRGGQRHAEVRAVGVRDRQLQHLHAAHRAADGGEQLADAQVVEQQHLRVHHVADGDHREVGAVGLAGGGILRRRPGAAAAAADDVGADDEVLVGVEALARADHHVPPARALVVGAVPAGDVRVAGERVRDQDGVVLALAQRAVGLVGERERRQRAAALEGELLAGLVERDVAGADDAGVAGVVVVPHGDVADLLACCGLLLGHGSDDSTGARGRGGRRRLRRRPAARPALRPWRSAWSMSAMMSSSDSMPTLRRTKSSVTPDSSCSSAVSCEWVVVAGWIASDLASPMLARCESSCVLSTNAPARLAAARRCRSPTMAPNSPR